VRSRAVRPLPQHIATARIENTIEGGCACALNALFDEWRSSTDGEPIESITKHGTVDWLFRESKRTKAYVERVSERSRLITKG
jgi:hypothetical protein